MTIKQKNYFICSVIKTCLLEFNVVIHLQLTWLGLVHGLDLFNAEQFEITIEKML